MDRLIIKVLFYLSIISTVILLILTILLSYTAIISLFFASILLNLTTYIILKPPIYREKCQNKTPTTLHGSQMSDIWLLQSKHSLSLPWHNAVIKEIGSCRIIKNLNNIEPYIPRLVILPQNIQLEPDEVNTLIKWIENGTGLLCECPKSDNILKILGLQTINTKKECSIENFLETNVNLKSAYVMQYKNILDEESPNIKQDLFYEKQIGSGYIFVLALEYAKWAFNITQGDYNKKTYKNIRNTFTTLQGIQTHDLRTDNPASYTFTPELDVFDHTLFQHIRDRLKIPAWWYYPNSKDNAFVLTFDEDWFGKKIKNFLLPNIPSTWFLVDNSSITQEQIDFLTDNGCSLQFHWNRFIIHINKFGLHLCLRKAIDQINLLTKKIKRYPTVSRIHYLKWDSYFDNSLFILKNAGIHVDSSFGPGRNQHGYRFSTGFPYFLSDQQGNPIGIEEVPFQIHDPMGNATLNDYLRLIEESRNKYHTAIVALFHPYCCMPSQKSYEKYTKLINSIDPAYTWCTTIEDLLSFWEERAENQINSTFDKNELSIKIPHLKSDHFTLSLPSFTNISKIFINGSKVPVRDKLILKAGEHNIKVIYSA